MVMFAGGGTIGLKMLADDPDLDVIVVPVGGGGLIAGIATAAKALNPEIEVIGVQAALYPSMRMALDGKAPHGGGQTVADGIAVKDPGRLTRPIIERLVSDVVLVGEPALENAIQFYLEVQRLVVEGAGAASLAALFDERQRFARRKVGLVVSGGNIDSRLLSFVLMRGLVRAGRVVRLAIQIPDEPGLLARVAKLIGDGGGNIVEVYHQRLFYDVPVKRTELQVVVETLDVDHVRRLVDGLTEAGYSVRQLSSTTDMKRD
jgi:threonine dehydratase